MHFEIYTTWQTGDAKQRFNFTYTVINGVLIKKSTLTYLLRIKTGKNIYQVNFDQQIKAEDVRGKWFITSIISE